MIVIKTRMRRIPDRCSQCAYEISAVHNEFANSPRCRAITDYTYGKIIDYVGGRPTWCPLRELEDAK